MAYYYKYDFVSPERLYAKIETELGSYFATGAIDNLLFPIWTEDCLKELGRGSYKINECVLFIDSYKAKLPPDFVAVREARACSETAPITFRKPGAFYKQIITRLDNEIAKDRCAPCDDCPVDTFITYKINEEYSFNTKRTYLLKPGNISARQNCSVDCFNIGVESPDIFDVRDGHFVTNFTTGDVHIVYYSDEVDDEGFQLIPDNQRIKNFIEAYIKYKIFEMLFNNVTDETFNQIQTKYQIYKQQADEARVTAVVETRLKTTEQKKQAITRTRNRLNAYKLR